MRLTAMLTLVLLALSTAVHADTAWIGDTLYVPIRSGPGGNYRIVHRGLKSGTPVQVLDWPDNADWVKVQYNDVTGYLGAQYLSRTPTAELKLNALQSRYDKTHQELQQTRDELSKVKGERDKLANENQKLKGNLQDTSDQLQHVQKVASDPLRLEKSNEQLNKKLSLLQTELDKTQAENSRLKNENTSSKWLAGAGILILGSIFGWLFRSRSGRTRSSWV